MPGKGDMVVSDRQMWPQEDVHPLEAGRTVCGCATGQQHCWEVYLLAWVAQGHLVRVAKIRIVPGEGCVEDRPSRRHDGIRSAC